jgi:hypothetical protein
MEKKCLKKWQEIEIHLKTHNIKHSHDKTALIKTMLAEYEKKNPNVKFFWFDKKIFKTLEIPLQRICKLEYLRIAHVAKKNLPPIISLGMYKDDNTKKFYAYMEKECFKKWNELKTKNEDPSYNTHYLIKEIVSKYIKENSTTIFIGFEKNSLVRSKLQLERICELEHERIRKKNSQASKST